MQEEIIAFTKKRLAETKEGTKEHAHYSEMLKELETVKPHVAEDAICESCQ